MVWGLCVVFMACALTIAVSGISEAGCCRGDARASGSSGLTAILGNFRVAKLCIGREVSSVALARLEELTHRRKIPIEHELRGKSFSWDGVDGDFLWPQTAPEEIATSAKEQ